MKTDLYTKAVLTVIAAALVCLVFQNFNIVTHAHAATSPVVQTISEPKSTNEVVDVNIKSIDGVVPYVNEYGVLWVTEWSK